MLNPNKIGASLIVATVIVSCINAQSSPSANRSQSSSIYVTVYRDVVRFIAEDARQVRVEVFNSFNEKIFDSDFVSGQALDWFKQDQQGRPMDTGLYGYSISVGDESANGITSQHGNVIVDREQPGLIDAPPLSLFSRGHNKGVIQPATAGVFDVNATGGSYNINTPLMGIGTPNPFVRLHVGAGGAQPVTAGSTLLVQDGGATAMVLKSTTGAEMFFYQDGNNGLFGTASAHPVGIRTNNTNRVWITASGNVGIGDSFTAPTSRLSVAGMVESTTGGFKFPDGTTQTTASTGGGLASVSHDLTLAGNGTVGSPLGIAAGGVGPNQLAAGAVTGLSIEVPLSLTGSSTDPVVLIENIGTGAAIRGQSDSGIGVYGKSASGTAGFFSGNVEITGSLSKGSGSFKIDHPLDPENKYLYHSFVESPDMMNIYNGNILTDSKGEATIVLPEYFEGLNRDFRYQLTVIGEFAQAIVATKIRDNRFSIKTDKPNVEVSWQVTGVRKDPYADRHRVPVEEKKTESERGFYLHPEDYGQPPEKGIASGRLSPISANKKQR